MFEELIIQHVMRKRRIILPSVTSQSLPHFFPHYLLKDTIFGERILNIKYKFCFSVRFC